MVKCPYCKEEITSLIAVSNAIVTQHFNVINGKYANYEGDEKCFEDYEASFFCPACNEILFNGEKTAIKFMNGKKVKLWKKEN